MMSGENTDYARAATIMGVLLLVIGTLVIGMGVGTTASMLVVTDGCTFQPEGVTGLDEPPACQHQAEQLSMWADCMFASGLFLLFAGVGSLYYVSRAASPEQSEKVAS